MAHLRAPIPQESISDDELGSDVEYEDTTPSSTAQTDEAPRIVYIGHLPHGLFERQLEQFLSQFGEVTNVVVPRSKRTNRFRGYAFAGFESPEVAQIVAETVHNYMLLGKRLVSSLVPPEKMDYDSFLKSKSHYTDMPIAYEKLTARAEKFASKVNKPLSTAQHQKRVRKLVNKDTKKRKQLEKLGIDYTFPGYGDQENASGEGEGKSENEAKEEEIAKETDKQKSTKKRPSQQDKSKVQKRKKVQ